jgi:hypothetical protein
MRTCSLCKIEKSEEHFNEKGCRCRDCGSIMTDVNRGYTGSTDKKTLIRAASQMRWRYRTEGIGGFVKPKQEIP